MVLLRLSLAEQPQEVVSTGVESDAEISVGVTADGITPALGEYLVVLFLAKMGIVFRTKVFGQIAVQERIMLAYVQRFSDVDGSIGVGEGGCKSCG